MYALIHTIIHLVHLLACSLFLVSPLGMTLPLLTDRSMYTFLFFLLNNIQ